MVEKLYNNPKEILKKLENIMKCDLCKLKFDYNIHKPLIIKCGHTFCKNCIYYYNNAKNSNKKFFICPKDNINHIFTLEKNINIIEPSLYPNLLLELILKEIFDIKEPKIKEKYIVYSKPDMKRNKSPENNKNINEKIIKKEKNENINIKINSGNQIINVNAINVNIDTGDKNKNNNINNKDNISISNEDLNTMQINEEININDKKLNFENDKINDDSIETIPYEEKSMTNMSFRDDFKELLNKNYELKYQMNNNLKTDENEKQIFSNTGIKNKIINDLKNKQIMKTYNKKMLINENKDSNKYYIKEKENELKYSKEKNSIYRNKKINENNIENIQNENDSLYKEESPKKDEKGNSSNDYYSKIDKKKLINTNSNIKKNYLNLNKHSNKSDFKDNFRKQNNDKESNIIKNMKTIGSNNSNIKQNKILSIQSINKDLNNNNDINDINISRESDEEKYDKNYRKNRTVFRKKKKIIYDDNENKNITNNTMNKIGENYQNEINNSLLDLKEKEKMNKINQYIFSNSPNTYNKKSLVSKNIYISNKNTIYNSINKSNSSYNKYNINTNEKTNGRKLDFDNSNNDEIINSGINNINNSNDNSHNNKRIKLSNIQKFKTINNSNSNTNLNKDIKFINNENDNLAIINC